MKCFGLRAAGVAVMAMLAVAACGGGGGSGAGGIGGMGGTVPPVSTPDAPVTFALSVGVSGGGRVSSAPAGIDCGSSCNASFASGASVTLTAAAEAGQSFGGWGGACSGANASCVVTMSEARSVSASFAPTTIPAGWTDAAFVSNAEGGADAPKMAIDAEGRALLVWGQRWARSGASGYDVWASRHLPGSGWDAPVLLDTSDATVKDVQVAIDRSSGRAVVSWQQLTSSYDLWARPFDPATGWGAAAQVETGTGVVGESSVGVDADGNAVAVWSQIGPATHWSIYANRYRPGSGWGTAAPIETDEVTGQADGNPKVAVAPGGAALAVWHRSNGTSVHLWTNRYTAAAGWGTAGELVRDAGASQFIGGFDLGMDGSGNALLAWGQNDQKASGYDATVWFKRFANGAWQTTPTPVAAPVQTNGTTVSTPVVALNAAGTALVAWARQDQSMMAALAPDGLSFGSAVAVRAASAQSLTSLPQIGIDDQGNALYAWTAKDSNQAPFLWLSRLTAGGGWSAPALHGSSSGTDASPTLAMNGRGDAAVAWLQLSLDQGSQIAARYYNAGR